MFGRRVAAARVWKGLEPKELAVALGRSTEAVNAMERGDRVRAPDKLLLEALAHELNVTPEWLLKGEEPPWAVSQSGASGSGAVDERLVQVAEQVAEIAATLDVLVSEQGRPPVAPQAGPARRRLR